MVLRSQWVREDSLLNTRSVAPVRKGVGNFRYRLSGHAGFRRQRPPRALVRQPEIPTG